MRAIRRITEKPWLTRERLQVSVPAILAVWDAKESVPYIRSRVSPDDQEFLDKLLLEMAKSRLTGEEIECSANLQNL